MVVKLFKFKIIIINYQKCGKSESQIKNLNKVLKGAFEYGIQEDYTQKNPCNYVVIPKQEKNDFDETEDDDEIDFFSLEEINKIVNECYNRIEKNKNHILPYLILFALGSGLRQGEELGLQRKFFKNFTAIVKKELTKIKKFENRKCIGYEFKLIDPKTKKSNRTVNISSNLFNFIENFINTVIKNIYEKNNKPFNNDSLIFVNENCNIIDSSNLRKQWKNFLKELQIPYKKWHALRSSFASLLFLNGADIKTVQELLGHSDINTTILIYLKVYPEVKKDIVNSLNNSIFKSLS